MSSIFAIDTINKFPFVSEANKIRLGILKDRLEQDDEVTAMASNLLIAIYDGNRAEMRRVANRLTTYIGREYGQTYTGIILNQLVNKI